MLFHDDAQSPRTRTLPLLPLRDIIVFPQMVVPLFVGREASINGLDEAMRGDKDILLAAQRMAKVNHPKADDIFEVGTIGTIIQLLRLPDGTVKVLIEGKQRAKIDRFLEEDKALFRVEVSPLKEERVEGTVVEGLIRQAREAFEAYVKLNKRLPPEVLVSINTIHEAGKLADAIVAHLNLKLTDKQAILELTHPLKRLERVFELMQAEVEILQIERRIRSRVKKQMEKNQKEYYLNEQMQAIQKELGDRDEFKNELQELEDLIAKKKLPKEAGERVQKELKKLKMMNPMSAEAAVVRNYIDWILSLPWAEYTQDATDISAAARILDEDHYGLDKPKQRILEYLAVHALVDKLQGPILCLVGPPGVGKTSLARSIARCMDRKFVRMSLGGVRDEAEIRGHRRTYIGALPGKIIQNLKKAGSGNPVILLDEIDKMSSDFRGDPSSALLEVLDPEQNEYFNDHYLDLDYDLSRIMFITTANNRHEIPLPLQDRLEIIELSGYTEVEKLKIAQRYLTPKQSQRNGVGEARLTWAPEALEMIIHRYTRESGVRSLEREIASVCRKIAKDVVAHRAEGGEIEAFTLTIDEARIEADLGTPRFKYGVSDVTSEVGLVNGLAYTSWGGNLLQTEVTIVPGKGKLIITGRLGEVMKESAQAALTYVRSRAARLGLEEDFYQKLDLHMHFPEGATPKDGPSAGVTMATALVSALRQIPVRHDVAMTGEITLRGRVLPIGGLKEKLLAAKRGGIKLVLIPEENRKDIADLPEEVREAIELVCVKSADEVLDRALAHNGMLWLSSPAP
ncbi:endopeptidase La [Myxococcota bacterium]|nr:endopeptidase La [Myxococcota bacterium]MBU1431067.1 endopeptidase La [Myxococcota bacterium]MBU1898771.1 endopeptidase La [Myxococcota bacterium]